MAAGRKVCVTSHPPVRGVHQGRNTMSQGQRVITRRDALKLAGGAASLVAVGGPPSAAHAAAPMLGPSRPTIYRFKLGGFEVTNILDGYVQNNGPHPTFGNNQPAEAVQAYARSQGLP